MLGSRGDGVCVWEERGWEEGGGFEWGGGNLLGELETRRTRDEGVGTVGVEDESSSICEGGEAEDSRRVMEVQHVPPPALCLERGLDKTSRCTRIRVDVHRYVHRYVHRWEGG